MVGPSWCNRHHNQANQADCVEIYRHGDKTGQLVGKEGIPVRLLPRFNERSYLVCVSDELGSFDG